MTLKDYLARPDSKTPQALAEETRLTEASISRISRGLQRPSHDAMRAIHAATGGAVTPNDFVGVAA